MSKFCTSSSVLCKNLLLHGKKRLSFKQLIVFTQHYTDMWEAEFWQKDTRCFTYKQNQWEPSYPSGLWKSMFALVSVPRFSYFNNLEADYQPNLLLGLHWAILELKPCKELGGITGDGIIASDFQDNGSYPGASGSEVPAVAPSHLVSWILIS